MNMLDGMNLALAYIEETLDGEMDYARIAKIAGCSQYHFQRMFAAVTEIPLSEYIRRRRLTLAAFDLQNTDMKIIDIGMKYGYQSPDAFTRAFQTMHGVTPSKVRAGGVFLKAYPRLTFTLSIKGVVAMKYRIEEKKAFRVIGTKKWFSMVDDQQLQNIPAMWSELPQKTYGELAGLMDGLQEGAPTGIIGLCADMYDGGFDYWIAVASTKPCPDGLFSMEIPASAWAMFEAVGPMPTALQDTVARVFSEWFPTSGYEHADAPEIEWYSEGDMSAEDYISEAWYPIKKKTDQ